MFYMTWSHLMVHNMKLFLTDMKLDFANEESEEQRTSGFRIIYCSCFYIEMRTKLRGAEYMC
ncbi:hypothetical protein PRUPE_8G174700 [Prunus persica]|uniref:Uncharacterized protein n=1 Tax=Prunus persica TaxID=3760 RepID=A0A251MZA0_PRUPE|nr:hypothetical protein PRUPE_8G174700 [Prunus persica]ONH92420.1 hypothetical protein PRUPE_8G174700 [Prunus persica]ONH92421.1 hypothetical protein PRUPE_8G174700 [Prunus persica]ONH92422.1 hypothetical protein PRUPE_8G174700 [Prunus persica]ONH92423.1 hypothetical protein PRUPE_8G174700 [Prunus persica]